MSLLCLTGSGTISIHAERLQITDAPRKQNESISIRLNTQFRVKESFELLLAIKVKSIWR